MVAKNTDAGSSCRRVKSKVASRETLRPDIAKLDRKIRAHEDFIRTRGDLPANHARKVEIALRREQMAKLKRERRNIFGGVRNGQKRQHLERDALIAAEVNSERSSRGSVKSIAEREGLSLSRVYAIAHAQREPVAKTRIEKPSRAPATAPGASRAAARVLREDRRRLAAVVGKIQRMATPMLLPEGFAASVLGWRESQIIEAIGHLLGFSNSLNEISKSI